jgi:hypothetical protein
LADSEDTQKYLCINWRQLFPNMDINFNKQNEKKQRLLKEEGARSQILINNNIIEQINTFNYSGCSIAYQTEIYITIKLSEFLEITGIIDGTLKPSQVQNHTRMKIYDTLALPNLLYGCESRAIKKRIHLG